MVLSCDSPFLRPEPGTTGPTDKEILTMMTTSMRRWVAGGAAVLSLAGLGTGLAMAGQSAQSTQVQATDIATPGDTPDGAKSANQVATRDIATPGDTPDGAKSANQVATQDVAEAGDVADAPGSVTDAPDHEQANEASDASEAPSANEVPDASEAAATH